MSHERRVFLEALIVSVLGHAIFFSVFTVKETGAIQSSRGVPAVIAIAPFQGVDLIGSRATADPAVTDPDLLAYAELQRRAATPKLELDRATFVWEDEPDFGPPPRPDVGPEAWGFAKEPGELRDQFAADYDAGPSLAMVRETLRGGSARGEGPPPKIQLSIPVLKLPGGGMRLARPDEVDRGGVRSVNVELQIDPLGRAINAVITSSTGDPEYDATFLRLMGQSRFEITYDEGEFKLRAWLALPASIRTGDPGRRPPAAEEVLGEEPETNR